MTNPDTPPNDDGRLMPIHPNTVLELLMVFIYQTFTAANRDQWQPTIAKLKEVVSPQAFKFVSPLILDAMNDAGESSPSLDYQTIAARVDKLEEQTNILTTLLSAFSGPELYQAATRLKKTVVTAPVDSDEYASACNVLDMLGGKVDA